MSAALLLWGIAGLSTLALFFLNLVWYFLSVAGGRLSAALRHNILCGKSAKWQ